MSGHTDNRIVIAAPLERVWALTNDVTRWPYLFSEYASAEILATEDNYVRFEYMDIRWEYRVVGDAVEMRWLQDFALKPTAPVDDAAMTEQINRNTPVQMERIKHLIETDQA